MVELLVVMNCGTSRYKTETFEDKKDFIKAINNVQIGNTTWVREQILGCTRNKTISYW